MGKNHRWLSVRLRHRLFISGVHFVRVVTTPVELVDILVSPVFYQLGQLGVLPEKMLASVRWTVVREVLQVTITDLVHGALHNAVFVLIKQGVPYAPPNDLDNIPARTTERAFQLLNNLAITPNRSIQTLQIAVNHEHQIIQIFPAGFRYTAKSFGLVGLAVTDKTPNLTVTHFNKFAAVEVLHYVGLINGLNRPKPHRYVRELPVVWHQPGMRIGGKAIAIHFLTVFIKLFFGKPAFKKRSSIITRRSMALKINQI